MVGIFEVNSICESTRVEAKDSAIFLKKVRASVEAHSRRSPLLYEETLL